ncbi:hypothetical protein SAMN05443429_102221 [Cruoricaptor ignavus]|uniref:Uncharacterized protein n=1 Tax=Cruoricaptor ignavus TaxID=1118202 RepID=A0A1M6C445_9FLAO|nr:hypothetical protein SAMN05443429_102221 [Cruoricaptor ignavus]
MLKIMLKICEISKIHYEEESSQVAFNRKRFLQYGKRRSLENLLLSLLY